MNFCPKTNILSVFSENLDVQHQANTKIKLWKNGRTEAAVQASKSGILGTRATVVKRVGT